jgi:hypothetical protein
LVKQGGVEACEGTKDVIIGEGRVEKNMVEGGATGADIGLVGALHTG